MAKTLSHFKATTAVGVVEWGKFPIANVCPTPLIGAQWIKAKPGSKYKLDLVVVDNADDPNVPIGAKLRPYAELRGSIADTAASSVDGGLLVGAEVDETLRGADRPRRGELHARGQGGGRHCRPKRGRQDHLAQRACRSLSAFRRELSHFDGVDVTARRRRATLPAWHCPLSPNSATLRRHDCVRKLLCRCDDRRRPVRAARLSKLRRCARALPNAALREPPGRNARAPRSQAPGARSRARDRAAVLLLDEIGGGLTDEEANNLVETIQVLRGRGLAIVWIEHIVHVLVRVVERLVCMDAGRIIADGKPDAVIADAAVIDAYIGGKSRAMSLLVVEEVEARHGLLQAVRGVSLRSRRGRNLGAGRSQRGRKDHAAAHDRRRPQARGRPN